MNEQELPPLPEPIWHHDIIGDPLASYLDPDAQFTAEQMREYARAALLAHLHARPLPVGQPVAWMYQHEESGLVGFVDCWQVDNGWEKANPRRRLIGPLVLSAPPEKESALPVDKNEGKANG